MDSQSSQNVPTVVPKLELNKDEDQQISAGTSPPKEFRKIRNKKPIKRQILRRLSSVGLDDYENFLSNPEWAEYDPADITKIINDFAHKSQMSAEAENKHLEIFHKTAELFSPTKETPVSMHPKNEIALAIDAIAHLERSVPKTPAMINIDGIYQHIASLMRGQPTEELGVESVNAIHEAIHETMLDVEGPQGQEDLKKLQDLLMADKYNEFTQNEATELKMILSDETFNPLKLPIEFFVNKHFFDRT